MFFLVQSFNCLVMTTLEKHSCLNDAKKVAPFFKVSVKIEVFGHVIWEITYPPKTN